MLMRDAWGGYTRRWPPTG